jgi:hypothetical protein
VYWWRRQDLNLRPPGNESAALLLSQGGRNWSGRRGSNPRPPPWQGGALPTELRLHGGADRALPASGRWRSRRCSWLLEEDSNLPYPGPEPGVLPLDDRATSWSPLKDLNPRPSRSKRDALSAELRGRSRKSWSYREGLNLRPHPYQGCALPTELRHGKLVVAAGLEPATSPLSGVRSTG